MATSTRTSDRPAQAPAAVWDDLRAEVELTGGHVPGWGSKAVSDDFLRNGGVVCFTSDDASGEFFAVNGFRIVDGDTVLHRQSFQPIELRARDSVQINYLGLVAT